MEDAVVGIVGQGFVGSAMKHYFEHHKYVTLAYDKFKPTGVGPDAVVARSNVIFVCVPTPMRESGACYTGIVESVLSDIVLTAREVGRPLRTFVVCLKTTVPPGFTDRARLRYGLRLVFSPEFLREKSANEDMMNASRVVVGGLRDDAEDVLSLFAADDRCARGECRLLHTSADEAEMSKLMVNGLLFTKVVFANEVERLCHALDIDYAKVRELAVYDPRIGASHLDVPGHDGMHGAGGHCFPKDMANLRALARQHRTGEKLFSAVMTRNEEVRERRDWEEMEGRAVIAGR